MKFKWDHKYLYWGITAFLVIAASIIFFIALFNGASIYTFISAILGILTPVAYGFAFAYLMSPIATFFEKKCFRPLLFKGTSWNDKRKLKKNEKFVPSDHVPGIRRLCRGLSVFVTIILALVLVVALVSAVLPQLVTTIQKLISNMPTYLDDANKWAIDVLKGYPDVQAFVTQQIKAGTEFLNNWLQNDLLPQITNMVGVLSSGIMGALTVFLNVILGFIISIYFLHSKELFAAQSKKLVYSVLKPATANTVLRNVRNVHKTFGGFLTGKLLDCFIIGVLFFILLTIFGMPYAMLISVFMGVANIIPYFGALIGAVPCALLILLENPMQCLYFIIMVIIIQQLDGNVISPKILGESTGLSSFWVIFAILLGQGIFGFVGLIIGIPLFAVIYGVVRNRVSRKLAKKQLPTDSNTYRSVGYILDDKSIVTVHDLVEKEKLQKQQIEDEEKAKKKEKKLIKFLTNKKEKK